jgi:hypothetical protein
MRIHDNSSGSEYTAKIRGNLYKKLVLDKLEAHSGCDAPALKILSFWMETGKANARIQMMDLPRLSLQPKEYSSLNDIRPAEDRVWIPHESNAKSFDALIAPRSTTPCWLHITVNQDHPMNATGVHDCLEVVDGEIVYCLPPDAFEQWHKNNSVQRFVMRENSAADAVTHAYLRERRQRVVCIPGDRVEEMDLGPLLHAGL